ncbi:MAG: type II secretion system protein GspG [Phycisphaerales bacterium]
MFSIRRSAGVVAAVVACACGLLAPVGIAAGRNQGRQPEPDQVPQVNPNRHIRVVEEQDGRILKLELSSRKFVPADPAKKGPAVYLTGAVHIADQSFYEQLQAFLDTKDVVLFESVKPPGAGAMRHFDQTDEQRVTATKRRIQLLALFVEQFRGRTRSYPGTLADLPGGIDPALVKVLDGLNVDGWDHPLIYRLDTVVKPGENGEPESRSTRFDLISYGSDGVEGGDGAAADLRYSDQKPVNVKSLSKEDGIQADLARAMGLVFQLHAMSHDKPNWRNSDLSVDQVQDRLELGGGADQADQLFSMIAGESMLVKALGAGLKILVSVFPSASSYMKIVMIDMLASADKLLANPPGGGGQMAALMDVIIKDRNQVVIDDLGKIIENEPSVKTVGVIYGAGHLPDMEERLINELGYRYESDQWFTAITVDVTSAGMSVQEANSMRKTMKRMLDMQLKPAKRGNK